MTQWKIALRSIGRRPGFSAAVVLLLALGIVVGGKGYAVVGVMPKSFANPSIDLWIPAQTEPFLMQLREARFMSGIGRMKPGIGIEQARAALARVQRALGEQFPKTDKGWSAIVRGLKDARLGTSGKPLLLRFAAVGLYGLVANMVNMRRREIGVRVALGARPGQIVRTMVGGVGRLIGAGILAGFALMAQAVLRAIVFGVAPLDGPSLAAAAGVLAAVSGIAAFAAGRRAASVNPIEAIRAE